MVQDTRGRHHSQGVFEKYYDYDAYDGYDTIEWAASRPYCDGQVGMYGTSYAAHTQADASKLAPPHLRRCCSTWAAWQTPGITASDSAVHSKWAAN